MSRWTPHRLPRIRADLVATTRRAAEDVPALHEMATRAGLADIDAAAVAQLRRTADGLAAAELYWVTPDMTRVALAASADLPEWTPAAAWPAGRGLLVWDEGLPPLAWQGGTRAGVGDDPAGGARPAAAGGGRGRLGAVPGGAGAGPDDPHGPAA